MDQMISTIMGWGPTWAPRSWSICGGQLLAISSNTALFSLIGTQYGGDGRTTFGLPDLRGRAPIGYGQSPGTSSHPIGAKLGSEQQTLTQLEMPVHNHSANTAGLSVQIAASDADATTDTPSPSVVPAKSRTNIATPPSTDYRSTETYVDASSANTALHPASVSGQVLIGNAGGSQPFSIMQPVQAINWIIALEGIFPSRN
jgi:microcystin-dependent protein